MAHKNINKKIENTLKRDFRIIIFSIIVAVLLVKTGAIEEILALTQGLWFFDSFVAGLFFTSIFTTAPAIVALGHIAQSSESVLTVALLGGLGALCGDLIIFRFMRDNLGKDIVRLVNNSGNVKLRSFMKLKIFRWMTFFIGALVISSPLPDELGLAMMGLSKTRTSILIPVSFAFNFLGILIIGLIAKNLFGG